MPGMTLRLSDADHALLRILTIVKRKSANQIIVDLLHTEFDREMPGKRQTISGSGSAEDRFRELLALPPLPDDDAAEAELDQKLAAARAEADRIYGDGDRQHVA